MPEEGFLEGLAVTPPSVRRAQSVQPTKKLPATGTSAGRRRHPARCAPRTPGGGDTAPAGRIRAFGATGHTATEEPFKRDSDSSLAGEAVKRANRRTGLPGVTRAYPGTSRPLELA